MVRAATSSCGVIRNLDIAGDVERAIEQVRQMKWFFPPDFKFNREEINER